MPLLMRARPRQELLTRKAKAGELVAVVTPGNRYRQDQTAGLGPVMVCLAKSDLYFAAVAERLRVNRFGYPCCGADETEERELDQQRRATGRPARNTKRVTRMQAVHCIYDRVP